MSERQRNWRELVEDLCDQAEGLTAWECDFVSDMKDWDGDYTEKQGAMIDKIWGRICGV